LYFTCTEIEKTHSRPCTLHILQAILGMMYPARGGLDWGQMRRVLSEVMGVYTPLGGVYNILAVADPRWARTLKR